MKLREMFLFAGSSLPFPKEYMGITVGPACESFVYVRRSHAFIFHLDVIIQYKVRHHNFHFVGDEKAARTVRKNQKIKEIIALN